MAAVLFTILKIILIIILVILALLLIILAVLLFSPIKYSAEGYKKEDIYAAGTVSYLFKAFYAAAYYENGNVRYSIKLFGREIGKIKKPEISEEKTEETPDGDLTEKDKEHTSVPQVREVKTAEKSESADVKKDFKKDIEEDSKKQNVNEKNTGERSVEYYESTIGKEIEEKKQKEFEQYKENCEKAVVRRVKTEDYGNTAEEKPEEKEKTEEEAEKEEDGNTENNEQKTEEAKKERPQKLDYKYFLNMPLEEKKELLAVIFKAVKRILKYVLPKDVMLDIKIGTSDPSLTGYILALAGVLKGTVFTGISVRGNFKGPFLEGEGKIKGKIIIGYLLYTGLAFVFARPVAKIIILYMKGRGVKK